MPTILIVDDEYLIADILGYALEDEGYMAVKAGNGKRALEILDRERPALVITDFMMPGMNGLELAQKIRSHASFESVPILLMSGAQGNVGRATPELFNAVYDKPFDINEVVARVRELVPLDPA
ncbi:Sporulation initiation phosphotransferase F [Pseudomonas sp. MM227]|uniref:Response regulator n=1 Tax=Pseudomonas baltica TaxID=2762576 RepID=A0A7X1G4T2_9PSED|nr:MULTISPECIES: response regulator [Pseudomonas]MBC2677794.1 response regulator [Pseudomonas baltica]MBD8593376.1 response regulator [Pseudomonas sp. CFBP 8758]MBD8601270.1 response regulator [Pseudomonas sp. CFBP 8771]MBD8827904.1 response regulator [Pseudomonas sp. CFBP 13602]CAI3787927.1 Sporulation initiation phosphotransferase F [Pseudomonas sp. MM227]